METEVTFDTNNDGITITGASDTLPKEMLERAPRIDVLRRRFDAARQDGSENRVKAQRDRDYYDGPKQLDSDVRETLKTRGQPAIYTNRVRPAINGVLGILENARSDPRAYPRNPDDEQSADICTKTLRFIADECRFDDTKMDVAENFWIEGTGGVIIEMDGDKIVATQIRWEELYFDPYSRRADFADASYMGVAKWMDAAVVRARWKLRIDEIGDPLTPVGFGLGEESWQDRPENQAWVDRRRHRVMLVEEYALVDGTWMRTVYIANGVLEYDVSPYLDDKGRPCNPIEAASCYVDRENNRYGMVRDMIPIQDEINASRSRSLHLMNSRQIQVSDPQTAGLVDETTARQEAARADGIIPLGWGMVPTSDMTQANILRNQEAKGELDRMAPTPALLGRGGGASESGRARLVLQQAGMTELARPMGRLSAWELRVFRQMWNRARQFWTGPMWIRVTDEIQAPEFLQVNEPVMGMVMAPVAGPDGQPVVDPMTGQPAMMPTVGQVGTNSRLAEMDMDIILDTKPDTANLQAETFAEFVELVRSGVDPFTPQFELLIEMSTIADKPRVLERLKTKRDEIQQGQAEAQQAAQQAAQEAQRLADAKTASEVRKNEAQTAQIEANVAMDAVKSGYDMGAIASNNQNG